jgi:lipid-A-disaccharide synthase-like uncharacterized protein
MVNLGLIGGFLLILAWLPMTLHTIKDKRSKSDLAFDIMFFLGAFFLAIYSWQIGDLIFVFINIFAMVVAAINLYYIPRKYSKLKKDVEEVEVSLKIRKGKRKRR